MNAETQQVGTLIVFKDGISYERIQRWIDALKEKDVVENVTIQSFDPNHGYPVFYIP
jgi:predicted transcriptional regulator